MSRNPSAVREGEAAPELAGKGRATPQGKDHGPEYQNPQNWCKDHEEWFIRRELEDKMVVAKGYDWDKTTEEFVVSFQEYGEIELVKWFVETEADDRKGRRGRWKRTDNSASIKFANSSSPRRTPGSSGDVTVCEAHGSRIHGKIIEVYMSDKETDRKR